MAIQEEKISAIQHILKAEYNSTRWKTFLSELFTSSNFFSSPTELLGINESVASKAQHIGNIKVNNKNGISSTIAVYEVKLAENVVLERNRVGLRNLLKPYWKQQEAAFIVYYHPQAKSWRFSYVSELGEFTDTGYVTSSTEPKRYTYVLGENESCRTAAIQFSKLQDKASNATLDDIKEAFSVEKMSKDFFDTYKDHYQDFVQFLTGKRLEKVSGKWEEVVKHAPNTQLITIFNNNEKDVRDFCKKLLGRIVFLYFIQKKGWLGVPLHDKWGNGKPDFISRLLANCRNPSIFYSEYLSKLFFETLNQPRPDDLAEIIPGEKTRVPYLNGGLFEEDDPNQRGLRFEAELFKDLFAFFDQYNFTIYEDDPNDHTVAVDPEMLGHIFENLLEDNKDKGAFYTPKEIVHYMCQESLIEYLTTWFEGKNYHVQQDTFISLDNAQQASFLSANEGRTGQGVLEIAQPAQSSSKVINRSLIEKLLKKQLSDDDKQAVIEHATEFNEALDKVKICDPAIGSGAFPMGLLLEIFTAKQTIHSFTHDDLTTFEPAKVKLNIIQNSIYGVDIERGAVDIARLRFWLSLVVDEPVPQPLPNLDYKIVVGNSLISKLGDDMIEIDWDVKKQVTFDMFGADETGKIKQTLTELNTLQKAFFNPKSDKRALAPKIRNLKIDLLTHQLSLMIETRGLIVAPRKLATQSQKDFVAQTELYQQTQGWLTQRSQLQTLKTQSDKALDFFDWQLNFAEVLNKDVTSNVGFDIVIGNPPYLRIQGIREVDSKFADTLVSKYKSATGSFDLYVLFAEKGLQLLKDSGIQNYIMPIKWVNSAFGKGLRAVVQQHKAAYKIISFEAFQAFDASTYTGLQWFKKGVKQLSYYQLDRDLADNEMLGHFLYSLRSKDFNQYAHDELDEEAWTLTDNQTKKILTKILEQPLKVKDVFDKFFTGLQTSKDSIYFLMQSTMSSGEVSGYSKELDKIITIEAGLVKPLLKGDQVHRYEKLHTDNYVIFPYKLESGSAILYTEAEIKALFPKGYAYLKENESALRDRENGRLSLDSQWFRYIYPKNLTLFDKPKLICPDISMGGNYAFDEHGEFYDTTTLYGYIKNDDCDMSYHYLLGLLNSNLAWYFLKNVGTVLANGYFRFMPRYVNTFPIVKISIEKQLKIEVLVKKVMELKSQCQPTKNLEQQINNIVYRLYKLTFNEVKVIDPDFALSEAEYNAMVI